MTTNPWKYVEVYDDGTNPYLYPKAEPVPDIPTIITPTSSGFTGGYILMPQTNTYALGVHALQEACIAESNQNQPKFTLPDGREVYRPNTFKENIEARMTDFNTLNNPDGTPRTMEERLRYFNTWLDSCCGIAHQKRTGKFKLDSRSPDLITIPKKFKETFKPINYAQIWGQEFDRNKAKYNALLTRDEVLQHPAWLAVLEGDKALLKAYRDIVFAEKKTDTAMGFWLANVSQEDQLQAVYVNILDNYSYALGNLNLGISGRFLRRSP